jgi:heat shock protein HtpX
MSTDFRELQKKNRRSTRWLLFCSFALVYLVSLIFGFFFSGSPLGAAIVALVISGGLTFFSYRSSSKIAIRSTRAVPADPNKYAQLHNLVEEMALASGLPKPDVYIVEDPAPNAFATGKDPDNAIIAATTGLLEKLDRNELQGVIAHEMAHIKNFDIRVMTVAVATAGAIALLADIFWRMLYFGALSGRNRRSNNNNGGAMIVVFIVGWVFVSVLAPLGARLLKAAISRSREELADATAVELTRNPSGIRQALEKLDSDVTVVRHTSHATSHLWIESPDDHEKSHKGRKFNDMFNTHPPLSERINLLRQMEGLPPYEKA